MSDLLSGVEGGDDVEAASVLNKLEDCIAGAVGTARVAAAVEVTLDEGEVSQVGHDADSVTSTEVRVIEGSLHGSLVDTVPVVLDCQGSDLVARVVIDLSTHITGP
jgi:hypothetical protein